jgi:hypothetical protein
VCSTLSDGPSADEAQGLLLARFAEQALASAEHEREDPSSVTFSPITIFPMSFLL